MAQTYAYALAGGLIATFTVTPALSALILPEHVQRDRDVGGARSAPALYAVLRLCVRQQGHHPWRRGCCWSLAGVRGALVRAWNSCRSSKKAISGFAPRCHRRSRWRRATPTSTGCGGSIRSFPEVESVVSQQGRPDDGTDAAGFFNAEFFVPLKPTSEWRPKRRQGSSDRRGAEEAAGRISGRGIQFLAISAGQRRRGRFRREGREFDQAVRQRPSGHLATRRPRSNRCWRPFRGITDLAVFTSLGQPTVQIDIDRKRAARYGLSPGDINSTIKMAIGGDSAGDLYEPGSDRHFPIVVRLAPQFRKSPEAIQKPAHRRARAAERRDANSADRCGHGQSV